MKAVFFHDAPLVKGINDQVYSVGFSYDIWKRYLTSFDSLIVSTRLRYDNSNEGLIINKMKISSGPRVEFRPISSYKKKMDILTNRKQIVEQIKESLKLSDFAIIRLPSFIGQIACKEAKKMRKPYLIEVVGCAFESLWNYSSAGKLLAMPTYLSMKREVINGEHVIYVTKEFLQNRYHTKGKSTNCSNVSLEEFDDELLENRIKKINNMDMKNKIIIGTTAAVDVRYKGQESVIKALGKLKKQGATNFEYQLVGGGGQSYLSSIAEKYDVTDQVKFLGEMPHEEVLKWLDSIDIYAQPSKTEGLPRALIEAMSRGLFAIGTTAGGIPELLDEKFIFSKSRNNELAICNILKEIKKDDLLAQAKRNYKASKEYDRNIIESRRQLFFKKFISQD